MLGGRGQAFARGFKSLYRYVSPTHQTLFLDYRVDLSPRYLDGSHPGLLDLIEASRAVFARQLSAFTDFHASLHTIRPCASETSKRAPCWNNGFLPALDMIALYGFISSLRPARYVEVGSGNSTKVAAKAIADAGLPTEATSIDPMPRAFVDDLVGEVIRRPLERVETERLAQELAENDILFIDGSHRCLPNSDVTVFFLEILPRLHPGVMVHIHDVFLPYDYPQVMCDRGYSEQYLLATALLANPTRYSIVLPNFFISEDRELCRLLERLWDHPNLHDVPLRGASSFWLRINEP